MDWHDIAPGKPMQNGYIESFNGRMRDEFLTGVFHDNQAAYWRLVEIPRATEDFSTHAAPYF